MPRISVIMGIYNCAHTLPIAIESILRQTYDDWELIMCDDGSTDNTYIIALEYSKKYPDKIITLKNKHNLRLAATLNKCLAVARGQYIARMDADDKCTPNRFKAEVDFLDSHPDIDCVGSSMIVFDETGEKGIREVVEWPTKDYLIHTTPFAHPTIMMRKSAFDALNGYTTKEGALRCDDTDLWFRFYAAGFKGYNIQEPLYYYHESLSDYKKRTLKSAFEAASVCLHGYKMLNYPIWKYIYALKPIVSALIPNSIMFKYHRGKDSK